MARIKTKVRFAGGGAFIQLLGVLAPVVGGVLLGVIGGAIGGVIGIALFFIGSEKSKFACCSECGNPVAGRFVKICPVCRSVFDGTRSATLESEPVPPSSGLRDTIVFLGGAVAVVALVLGLKYLL
ncbi:TPA: hypothetical protein NI771_006514 [Pseudomonas aeruginosa]|jgi:hypothetical protein|uniref:hypothetical protein n=1 Tax=Pseudomonas aeruginosa TaxID=287 RepID=UPI001E35C751|nr:hypothetical protein [Pseudomonas aeruginosa]EKP5708476.1 hypothetical protein [Pseudomonas aeruginosa]HCE5720375.1 hypothetical protein [Pseudomonas aeruginosa]HCF9545707.1 hypothetical protein [Pseudomonas aeruginosa]HCF9558517.1 hypothetical protein [Pseudomonas aeruginosa]HCF9578747.1 hypothetical protein [Pseudomonas aeruginosa]